MNATTLNRLLALILLAASLSAASALECGSYQVLGRTDYDAFGTLIDRTGTTDNSFLYCGERWDANLGFYYLRARYMNPGTGRFWTMDEWEGGEHTYVYAQSEPVGRLDPSGLFSIVEMINVQAIRQTLETLHSQFPRIAYKASKTKFWDVWIGLIVSLPPHAAVYVDTKASHSGFIYDVNPLEPGKEAMTPNVIPGHIRIRPTSLRAFEREYKVRKRIASFNYWQYLSWELGLKLLDATGGPKGSFFVQIDYSFLKPSLLLKEPFNCITWAVKAAGTAVLVSRFGN